MFELQEVPKDELPKRAARAFRWECLHCEAPVLIVLEDPLTVEELHTLATHPFTHAFECPVCHKFDGSYFALRDLLKKEEQMSITPRALPEIICQLTAIDEADTSLRAQDNLPRLPWLAAKRDLLNSVRNSLMRIEHELQLEITEVSKGNAALERKERDP